MSFIEFAHANGVLIQPARFDSSGKIKRCGTAAHPRSTNGAYAFDGMRGWVFRWDGDAEPIWFNDPNARPWTEDEKREWARKQAQARQDQENKHQRAAQSAEAMLRSCKPDEHSYFAYKSLKGAKGLVLPDGGLFVPMRNVVTNRLQGAQVITWDGENMTYVKKMIYGMKAGDAVLRIGPRTAAVAILCEGYATGLSIERACHLIRLGAAVVVCFSAYNLKRVAEHFPQGIVYADNDRSGTGAEAAQATGLRWCMSEVAGHDANDDHEKLGLLAVANRIMDAMHSQD